MVEYAYDFGNRWVRKVFNPGEVDEERTIFVYDGNQIALQFDKTGTGDMVASNLTHRYLWGTSVDQILADETVDGGGAEDVLWPLTDHLNTVRDLAAYDPQTDETTVVSHLVYNAFGELISGTNPTLFGFTARPFDPATGLQNNLNRWYDATVGRWLSEDPIGFVAGDENLYRYVDNRAIALGDPLGTSPFEVGFDDPFVVQDKGAGAWNSSATGPGEAALLLDLRTALLFYLHLGVFTGVTGPHAVEHLIHYFSNTGTDYYLDAQSMLRSSKGSRQMYRSEVSSMIAFAKTAAFEQAFQLNEAVYVTSTNTKSWEVTEAESKDWFFAVGGYQYWSKGIVRVTCREKPQPTTTFTLDFRFHVADRYNWDGGKAVTILGIPITDEFLAKFHRAGYAQEFDLRGATAERFTWTVAGLPSETVGPRADWRVNVADLRSTVLDG